MTDPESDYLEQAAALLAKASADNEKRAETAAELAAAKLPFADILREVNDRRLRIAEGFIALAAIERGVGTVDVKFPAAEQEGEAS